MTRSDSANAMIEEMKELLGTWTDKDLANQLGLNPTTVAAWRRRGRVPEGQWLRAKALSIQADARAGVSELGASEVDVHINYVFLEFYEKWGSSNVLLRGAELTRQWWARQLIRFRNRVYSEFNSPESQSTIQKLQMIEDIRARIGGEDGFVQFNRFVDEGQAPRVAQ